MADKPLGLDEVMNILDEASHLRAIADLRAANIRLRKLIRMKDDCILTVTHELRTPLTSIRAFAELLYDNPDIDTAERTRFLGIIVAEAKRLSRLINPILDLAKLESGRADWTSVSVDLAQVIDAACASVSQLYKDKGVTLTRAIAEPLPRVMADRDRLMQVLINLLSNALKFAPAVSGWVKVGAGAMAGEVRVTVTDNGPGVRPAERDTVFEKFGQGGPDVLADKPPGTGMGLPISRRIVEYFGGRLWLEPPQEQGDGAYFVFTLPLPTGDNKKQ